MPGRFGGAKGDRTPDLIVANDTLSQLSYCPMTSFSPDRGEMSRSGGCRDLHRFGSGLVFLSGSFRKPWGNFRQPGDGLRKAMALFSVLRARHCIMGLRMALLSPGRHLRANHARRPRVVKKVDGQTDPKCRTTAPKLFFSPTYTCRVPTQFRLPAC